MEVVEEMDIEGMGETRGGKVCERWQMEVGHLLLLSNMRLSVMSSCDLCFCTLDGF